MFHMAFNVNKVGKNQATAKGPSTPQRDGTPLNSLMAMNKTQHTLVLMLLLVLSYYFF